MKKFAAVALTVALALCAVCALAEDVDYRICTDVAFRPFEWTDETGTLVGIDVDILAAIAEDQGFTYTLDPLEFDACVAACQAGQMDALIAGASITDERKANGWVFTDGYFTATQSMAVAKYNAIINSFEDLKKLQDPHVAVKNGTVSNEYADSLAEIYGFTVMTFGSSPEIYDAVNAGTCAACFDDTPVIVDNIRSGLVGIQLVPGTENEGADYGLAVFKDDKGEISAKKQELIDKFNAGLANIRANGKYDEILAKYLSE